MGGGNFFKDPKWMALTTGVLPGKLITGKWAWESSDRDTGHNQPQATVSDADKARVARGGVATISGRRPKATAKRSFGATTGLRIPGGD